MRSSKSRSRSKSNRQRSMGNIVNRVFDSSGPEGKVRGTPQQIIDKYNQLARDAGLGNDRVAAENFQQHAEHYARMLGEAQREQEARREQQEQQQRERQRERFENSNGNNQSGQQPRQPAEPEALQSVEPVVGEPAMIEDEIQSPPQPDLLIETPVQPAQDTDSALVETPEGKPKPRRQRARKPKPDAPAGDTETAAEDAPKPKRSRKPKANPEAEASTDGSSSPTPPQDSPEAAE